MDITSILIIGFGVSMDAFAVALIKGLCLKDHQARSALIIGLTFGFFQGFMTWSGYHLGKRFMDLIANVDHWIAWILLLGIGSKMIYDALQNEAIVCEVDPHLTLRSLLSSGIATSIDALAIGISLSWDLFIRHLWKHFIHIQCHCRDHLQLVHHRCHDW